MQTYQFQDEFDLTIGQLDRVLSKLVLWGKLSKERKTNPNLDNMKLDEPNQQTLKHHAEDMIAAGQKILKDLMHVEGTPQPEPEKSTTWPTCEELAEIDEVP